MAQSVFGVRFSFPTFGFLFTCALVVLSAVSVTAQRKTGARTAVIAEEPSSSFQKYRGIQLGMTADEVRQKLGEPKDKGAEQDFYVFNETETAQIVYDKSQKVVTISADFFTTATDVLTAKQVFGTEVEAKPDGSVYKMVRFPKAGYWLSYSRTSGTSPMTSVTLQKIN
jgi:outer membrane protein assembly factor BamE (lipoprotein component of BamABCDE complex)